MDKFNKRNRLFPLRKTESAKEPHTEEVDEFGGSPSFPVGGYIPTTVVVPPLSPPMVEVASPAMVAVAPQPPPPPPRATMGGPAAVAPGSVLRIARSWPAVAAASPPPMEEVAPLKKRNRWSRDEETQTDPKEFPFSNRTASDFFPKGPPQKSLLMGPDDKQVPHPSNKTPLYSKPNIPIMKWRSTVWYS